MPSSARTLTRFRTNITTSDRTKGDLQNKRIFIHLSTSFADVCETGDIFQFYDDEF